jgi:hypothetical protein
MTLMGVVKDYHGLVACRVMLGVCEAGFFPGAVYIITTWYVLLFPPNMHFARNVDQRICLLPNEPQLTKPPLIRQVQAK